MNQPQQPKSAVAQPPIPVYLLKTKSYPTDAYEDHLKSLDNGRYRPYFVPVLEHHFNAANMRKLDDMIKAGAFVSDPENPSALPQHGGMIFTSQRAVDAFGQVIAGLRLAGVQVDDLLAENMPLYVVGPATARALRALGLNRPVLGEECGNGEMLATFIAAHYGTRYEKNEPSLLFAVGEKHRDIIPQALSSEAVPSDKRIDVQELVLYESVESPSLSSRLEKIIHGNEYRTSVHAWFVIFSPTGCKTVMEILKRHPLNEETEPMKKTSNESHTYFVATIGPTTRNYLNAEFNLEPHVCAAKPTPSEVGAGIKKFADTYRYIIS